MTLNSNQFLQSVEVGFCDRNTCCFNPIPVVVAASQATAIGVGVAVSLATNTVNTVPKIVAASGAPATNIFGFTFIHAHKNVFAANDRTDVLPLGSGAIIYLKAGSSFSAGAKLAYNATAGTVGAAASTNEIIGQALIGAAASGDVVPVYLNQQVGTKASS